MDCIPALLVLQPCAQQSHIRCYYASGVCWDSAHAAAGSEPPASLTDGLFGRRKVSIPLMDWLYARLLA